MALLFEPRDVFAVAVRIEENGERFYRALAKRFRRPALAAFFSALADDEVRHREFYAETLAKLGPVEVEEGYAGEYLNQLRAYADEVLFSPEEQRKRLRGFRDLAGALAGAIRAELDSILYYQEIRQLVPASRRRKIDEIIEEERRHLVRLAGMKNAGPGRGAQDRAAGATAPAKTAGARELPEDVTEVIREAVRLEVQGWAFFSSAAAATEDPRGKVMFERLAADEQEHLRAFTELISRRTGGQAWKRYLREEEQRSAPEIEALRERLLLVDRKKGADELEALRIGMELERKAIEFFEGMARRSPSAAARELAQEICEQERAHYDLLQAQYDSVHGSGFWFDAAEFRVDGEY
jgi:rubrerythrin